VLQKLSAVIVGQVADYVMRVRRIHLEHMYIVGRMIAMDEVALWFDMLDETTSMHFSFKDE